MTIHTIATVLLWSLLVLSVAASIHAAFSKSIDGTIRYLAYACAGAIGLLWIG